VLCTLYLAEREFLIMQVEIRMYSLDVGQRDRERDDDLYNEREALDSQYNV